MSIGGYIILTCQVHGENIIDNRETRQWSKGTNDELLCYNGRINNPKKYEENVLQGNKFSLKILNVTKTDLNVVYQCRYGFDAASKFIKEDKQDKWLSLRSATDVITFGGAIILTCVVNGISTIDSDVTRQWSMGNDDQLLSYNGRINNRRKYEETVLPGNEFSLKIFNITEADVNVAYRCRYGFETATNVIKITDDNYIYPPTPESTIVSYFMDKQTKTINISIYFEKVFPLPNCSINVDAPTFDTTYICEDEIVMKVNLSLSLQKRVACNRLINISCHIAGNQYDIWTFKLKDECSLKGNSSSQSILTITLIPTGLLVLISVLVIAKCLISQQEKKTRKGNSSSQSILTITLIPTGLLVLISVLVIAKCLISQQEKKIRKGYPTTDDFETKQPHGPSQRSTPDVLPSSTHISTGERLPTITEKTTDAIDISTLIVNNGFSYGNWSETEYCAQGHFAIGYSMKVPEKKTSSTRAVVIFHSSSPILKLLNVFIMMNAIRLQCGRPHWKGSSDFGSTVIGVEGSWGEWTSSQLCPNGEVMVSFSLQVEQQITVDKTAANYVRFKCRDIGCDNLGTVLGGSGKWGSYGAWSGYCTVGSAICGLQVKMEPKQGEIIDDTSLNDVNFCCCKIQL
ncbi:unnamed protein product [Mytilus coruscus]|uniref:Ig-like domain-containing protein n=1 Tax=Mytilus coruscus TaxID=42192 RepID=A0A6J8DAN1_MYTCO|nr:unnamed protein product [Mytilus coruscus]